MQRIYYTTVNCGDGSSAVVFFESKECIDFLEEKDPEGYASGEGGSYFDVEGTIHGLEIQTLEEVIAEYEDF